MKLRSSPGRRLRWLIPLMALLVVAAAVGQYLRPVPAVRLVRTMSATVRIPGTPPKLAWPSAGEGAVAVSGVGLMGSSGGNQPEAIGSVAKIMTALLVLKAHPLGVGASGPEITISPQDVATYQADLATQQSVVAVSAGEQLSEQEALQALLLPSGNNIATVLAQWDAGSEGAFVAQMNAEAKLLGLTKTHFADASGLSSSTVSNAVDVTRLAEVAMRNRTFASIVAMPQVNLPVAGLSYNVNADVTHDGFIGVKTGSTQAAGGCFVFAVQRQALGRRITVVGAVLGQGGISELDTALAAGSALANSAFAALTTFTAVSRGGPVANLTQPWAAPVQVSSPKTLSVVGWPGLTVGLKLRSARLRDSVPSGQVVGRLQLVEGGARELVSLRAPAAVRRPSLGWRLTRL